MIRRVVLALGASLLTACGGVKPHLVGHDPMGSSGPYPPVELAVGERVLAVTHSSGMTSIGGGYRLTLQSGDLSVVRVEVEEDGRSTRVFLRGVTPGDARLYYVNGFVADEAEQAEAEDYEVQQAEEVGSWFEVRVYQ